MTPDATRALERLEAAEKAMTPTFWRIHPNPRFWILLPGEIDGDPNRDNNAAGIALLRNCAPALIACARALEEFVGRYPRYGPDEDENLAGCCGWCAQKQHQEDCDVGLAEKALAALAAAVPEEEPQ